MIIKRFFKDSDAEEVANLVKETMLTTNIKDYSNKYLENDLEAVQDLWFLIYFYVKSEFKLWKIIPAILLGNNLN